MRSQCISETAEARELAAIARAQAADSREAYDELLGLLRPRVMEQLGRQHTRDTREDLCQEVLVRVWRSLAAGTRVSNFRGWLWTIVDRVIKNEARRRQRLPVILPLEEETLRSRLV